jgi:hypothetical protein
METTALNYWAILVAALSAFLIGGLWYSPAVFGKSFTLFAINAGYSVVTLTVMGMIIGAWR